MQKRRRRDLHEGIIGLANGNNNHDHSHDYDDETTTVEPSTEPGLNEDHKYQSWLRDGIFSGPPKNPEKITSAKSRKSRGSGSGFENSEEIPKK